jgi:hypothetical protein
VRTSRYLAAATLAAIGGLHVAWGRGATLPFATRDELADAVVGRRSVPPPTACNAVAASLFAAAALVADAPVAPRGVRRLGRGVVATVLGVRGVLGVAGRTDLLSPGSASPRFRELDRRFYGPLCIALAFGAAT